MQEKALIVEHKALIERQEELASVIARLYEDKINGELDDETYHLLSNKFKSERSDNCQKIQKLQERIQRSQSIIDGVKQFWDAIAHYSQIDRVTREVLHELVDYIRVYSAIRSGKEHTQRIEIHFLHIGKVVPKNNPVA